MQITELVKERSAAIKSFSQKEKAAKQSEEQSKIDTLFGETIESVKTVISEVMSTSDQSDFIVSEDIKNVLTEILRMCSEATVKDKVNSVDINSISSKENEIRHSLQYEWSAYFAEKTASVIDVLNVIKTISNTDVNSFINRMNLAKNWNSDVNKVTDMMCAINDANSKIDEMKLTDTTVNFLKKVIAKNATLDDITDEVMTWLQQEDLKKRVKISF